MGFGTLNGFSFPLHKQNIQKCHCFLRMNIGTVFASLFISIWCHRRLLRVCTSRTWVQMSCCISGMSMALSLSVSEHGLSGWTCRQMLLCTDDMERASHLSVPKQINELTVNLNCMYAVFLPVWVRMWPCSSHGLEKHFPQTLHLQVWLWVFRCMEYAGMET